MNVKEFTASALSQGRTALTEAESKELLAAYGVPVAREIVARDPDQAVAAAVELGFPVVLKGLGVRLTHKTERGLVHLRLGNSSEVRAAAEAIGQAAGADLDGYLVAPFLSGRREFVAGLFRDPDFGPVVMFGLGGVLTEALDDVVFRIAPLSPAWAESMVTEIRSGRLLDSFRGEAPVHRPDLTATLLGLSRLSQECPEVAEVDLNPLLVGPDGRVTAVDALVVLRQALAGQVRRPPIDPAEIGIMFHPQSVAFIGASNQFRKWGHMVFTNVLAGGYQGRVYLVNPKARTIAGRPVYRSVSDLPEAVDLAVVTVPAAHVLGLIPELAAKGIRRMVLITSGFAETGPEGRDLEQKLVDSARDHGLIIMGPNTMGICNPHHHFHCLGSHVRPEAGSTAFVSQSGNMGVQLLSFAEQQGLGIRIFAGSGNEAMVTIEDALDAFTHDRLTSTVLMYIESIKDGSRFFQAARRVSRIKPVVVLRGGRSQAGRQAAASHTGALAGSIRVFEAASRQAGIVLADRPMDLLDLSAAFSSLPLPRGRRVAIMTLGGGWGVVTADLCQEFRLEVPHLTPEIVTAIDQILPPYWSKGNPVDLVGESDPSIPLKVMAELAAWEGCDAVINLGILGRKISLGRMIESATTADPEVNRVELDQIMDFMNHYEDEYVDYVIGLMERWNKPILGVSLVTSGADRTVYDVPGRRHKGIFFPSPERAVKALAEMCQYGDWLGREGLSRAEWPISGEKTEE